MHSRYLCGIEEINAINVRKLPNKRKVNIVAVARNGYHVLYKTKAGTLYSEMVSNSTLVGSGAVYEIELLFNIGAISKEAWDEYLKKADNRKSIQAKSNAAYDVLEGAAVCGIKLTKHQERQLKKLRDANRRLL